MNFKRKPYLELILTFIATIALYFFDFYLLKTISIIAGISLFIYYGVRLLKRYVFWFLQYMFNQEITNYDKRLEKPRLVFYLFFWLPLLLLIFWLINGFDSDFVFSKDSNPLTYGLIFIPIITINLLISFIFFLLRIVWGDKLLEYYIPKLEKSMTGYEPSFIQDQKTIKRIYKEIYKDKRLTNSEDEFLAFVQREKPDELKINWVHNRRGKSKMVSNITIFDLLAQISVEPVNKFDRNQRKAFINFIINNFTKKGEKISYDGLNNTYSSWR